MIEQFFIITEAGIPIFFRSYSNKEINHILISGFLSAIDELAKAGMNSALKQVQLDNRYITIMRKRLQQGEEVRFILVHQHCLGFRRQEDCMCVPSSLEKISSEFFSQFININDLEFESNQTHLDFEDLIDSVIRDHFLSHSMETGYISSSKFFEENEIPNQYLLGVISFINDQLNRFYLDPTFSNLKFYKLIKLAGIWSELLGMNENVFPILKLKDFELASSLRISETKEKVSIFSLWASNTEVKYIRKLHKRLCDTLISSKKE
jgi:hypothetical protein